MKKITFLTVLLVALTATIISQPCLPEGITFSSQSMIDDFQTNYPDCEIIEGNVKIKGDDISNLDGLSSITDINGHLEILDNPNLLNLSGLSNLTYIGDYLTIKENPQLTNFIGLNNLATIGGSFSVYINNQLTNFMGLDSLSSIGGYFDIMVNENLINFIGISNLSSVGSELIITQNSSLTSLSGLENLSSDLRYFVIQDNPVLTDLTAMQNVSSISYQLGIFDNNSLDNLSGLENISLDSTQRLKIKNNPQLSECAIQNICNYLLDSTSVVEIEGNATGCNNQEEVIAACHDGIEEPINYNLPIIYPNPTRDFLFIDAHGSIIEEVVIYNEFGQKRNVRAIDYGKVDVSNLNSGIYIIEMKTNDLKYRKVFVVAE